MKTLQPLVALLISTAIFTSCNEPCSTCISPSATPVTNVTSCPGDNPSDGDPIWCADLRVDTLTLTNSADGTKLNMHLVVSNNGDDTAAGVQLIVGLPAESDVYAFDNPTTGFAATQCRGQVIYTIDSLDKMQPKTFDISIGRFHECPGINKCPSPQGFENVCAFITSETPDLHHHNNFKHAGINCVEAVDPVGGEIPICELPVFVNGTCELPAYDTGRITLPKCAPADFQCTVPVPIDEICKYVINCPGCDFSSLCIGDLFRFEHVEDFDITLYLANKDLSTQMLQTLEVNKGVAILRGTKETQQITKDQRLILAFKPKAARSTPTEVIVSLSKDK
ncbi:MAG: hypothetical protein ACKVOR_05350 [Flavobacteriales bacterium]